MKIYGVINMDIIGSRKLKNRETIQKKINKYLEYMNESNKYMLVAPIAMTLGDEWQIVLERAEKCYYIIGEFQKLLRELSVQVYAGFGIGTMSTGVHIDVRNMDGECFIKAREALNIIKNKNRFYNEKISSKKNNVYFNGSSIYFNDLQSKKAYELEETAITLGEDYLTVNSIVNSMIENNEILKEKITYKQQQIINLYEKFGSYNKIISADKANSKADISQKINNSNYFVIKNNNITIERLLRLYCNIKEGMRHEL